MANPENGQHPDLIDVKLAYLHKLPVDPCRNDCDTSPEICGGTDNGLAYDPDIKGAICLKKRQPIVIGEEPSSS